MVEKEHLWVGRKRIELKVIRNIECHILQSITAFSVESVKCG